MSDSEYISEEDNFFKGILVGRIMEFIVDSFNGQNNSGGFV